LLHSGFSGLPKDLYRPSNPIALSSVLPWIQGLLVGLYLCIQGVNWTYGHALMEEWRLTRWHARARLHFLEKIPIYAGPNLLGGKEELVGAMVPILERLGMLTPPRANDLRISALGREITSDGSKRGRFEALTARGMNGWRASGSALSLGGRSADAVVLGVQNAAGEWVAVAAATPISPPRYLRRSTAMDLEFLAVSGPQKRGEWELDLPVDALNASQSGILRAWAMDFQRRVLYPLPGDQHFTLPSESTKSPEAAALQERKPGSL
jgi:hypothetical protein